MSWVARRECFHVQCIHVCADGCVTCAHSAATSCPHAESAVVLYTQIVGLAASRWHFCRGAQGVAGKVAHGRGGQGEAPSARCRKKSPGNIPHQVILLVCYSLKVLFAQLERCRDHSSCIKKCAQQWLG